MLTLVLSAVFPVVVFLVVIYNRDTQKEPPKLVFKCFFWGCVSVLPIVPLEMLMSKFNVFESSLMSSFYEAFAVAALIEEGVKFLFLYLIIWKRREFDQYFDGIVYAVFVSLGFALVENILYVAQSGFGTAILRAILSVPGHGLFGVAMGYFFAFAKFSPGKKTGYLWLSFLIPLLFHGLYDFFLFYMGNNENTVMILLLFAGFGALMIILWRVGTRAIKKHRGADNYYLFRGPR